jgi:hypothetical protein
MVAKAGALVSTAGVALLVAFVLVLLVFPVDKECGGGSGTGGSNGMKCSFQSTAPGALQGIIHPGFLAASLLTIAAGIVMIRYSRWRESRTAL